MVHSGHNDDIYNSLVREYIHEQDHHKYEADIFCNFT